MILLPASGVLPGHMGMIDGTLLKDTLTLTVQQCQQFSEFFRAEGGIPLVRSGSAFLTFLLFY